VARKSNDLTGARPPVWQQIREDAFKVENSIHRLISR
jgi:hypothetical protein